MMDKKNFNLNNPALAMVSRVQSQQAGLGVQSADAAKTKKIGIVAFEGVFTIKFRKMRVAD